MFIYFGFYGLQNPSKKSTYKNFSDLVQSNSLEIVESLKNINIIKPTTIQEKAIPVVASGINFKAY